MRSAHPYKHHADGKKDQANAGEIEPRKSALAKLFRRDIDTDVLVALEGISRHQEDGGGKELPLEVERR